MQKVTTDRMGTLMHDETLERTTSGKGRVADVHAAGFGVLASTVNDSELALDLLDWGVDALVTDQINVTTPHFAD